MIVAHGTLLIPSLAGSAQVVAHMMPDLPNVGWERDLESFREYFENPAFRSDGLKLYPTLVIRGTGLYELWKQGLYRNYQPEKVNATGCLHAPTLTHAPASHPSILLAFAALVPPAPSHLPLWPFVRRSL